MSEYIDYCQFCKVNEAVFDDYGIMICMPCLGQRPDVQEIMDQQSDMENDSMYGHD